eukprot:scaffold43245_cov206-Amphora_coffeaeformis.AAC.1
MKAFMIFNALLLVLTRLLRSTLAHPFVRFRSPCLPSSPPPSSARQALQLARGGGRSSAEEYPVGFQILSETIIHDNWRKLSSRKVQLPSGKIASFEIVSQGDRGGLVTDEAVMIFVWNRSTQTATLIREYMPSVHKLTLGLAAGMVEDKHKDDGEEDSIEGDPVYTAGVHELEEECRLKGGTWYRLCAPTAMDKYATTLISVYLVVDPLPLDEGEGKARDETEEGMQVIPGITAVELEEIVTSGGMTVVGGWATQLALSKLRAMRLIE